MRLLQVVPQLRWFSSTFLCGFRCWLIVDTYARVLGNCCWIIEFQNLCFLFHQLLDNRFYKMFYFRRLLEGSAPWSWWYSQSHIATDGQSVSLDVEPHLGLMTRYLLLFDSYGHVFVGRPLWREDGCVFFIRCWPLIAQSFSGPRPLVLAIIFFCLRFETSILVVSYDSQGHGGGIRPRLHTGYDTNNILYQVD
jgi:hypothetical protein